MNEYYFKFKVLKFLFAIGFNFLVRISILSLLNIFLRSQKVYFNPLFENINLNYSSIIVIQVLLEYQVPH